MTAPVRTADFHPRRTAADRFNAWLALKVTAAVGSMWCAWCFAVIALLGLPAALKPNGEGIIAWIAQTFLQLVLLSVILVGQNLQAAAADARSEQTFRDVESILAQFAELHRRHDELEARLSTREEP